jgi:hypothetical protein
MNKIVEHKADYLLALKGNHPRGLRVSGARQYSGHGVSFSFSSYLYDM